MSCTCNSDNDMFGRFHICTSKTIETYIASAKPSISSHSPSLHCDDVKNKWLTFWWTITRNTDTKMTTTLYHHFHPDVAVIFKRGNTTFGSHSSGTEAVGNKSDGGRSTECWSGFVSAYGLRISTLLGFDLPSFSVWPLQSSRCAIESRNKSLVKSVDPMAPKPIPISSIVQRLEWRGQTQKDGGSNPSEVEILNP